jgi:hypothetical protein
VGTLLVKVYRERGVSALYETRASIQYIFSNVFCLVSLFEATIVPICGLDSCALFTALSFTDWNLQVKFRFCPLFYNRSYNLLA